MEVNVGTLDRGVRVVMGLALLSLLFFLSGNLRWVGLIGVVPLMTGLAGNCPMYRLFGCSSCPLPKK
jgi:Protein of unknown function (DUF2892)